MSLLAGTGFTFVRVVTCLMLGSIWTVPVGIWVGTSQRRMRMAQPVVQILASFPAPMLYPLALAVLFVLKIPFGLGAMFLMLLGAQWYILFNVLAGAMRIPLELKYAALLMNVPKVELWKKLYLPSVFPATTMPKSCTSTSAKKRLETISFLIHTSSPTARISSSALLF